MNAEKKERKSFKLPSAYTVLLAITAIVALVTQFIPEVTSTKLSDFLMSPVNGLQEAFDVCVFILLIGGFLGVVTETGALDAGICAVVKKLKGKELMLIPILMFLFSLGGTSYGMAEETIAFYALIVATMVAAGFDQLVGVAVIMLGAGSGVLGSTVNPFLVSVCISSLKDAGIPVSQPVVIGLGVALWLSSLAISIYFVMNYAKKVKENPNLSLVLKEKNEKVKDDSSLEREKVLELTKRRIIVLGLFALSFLVMIVSVIPWNEFGITIFDNTDLLTGVSLGGWWFNELAVWFLLMSIIIGVVHGMKEKEIVNAIVSGVSDMVGVALVIGVSRGVSVVMSSTGLDSYVLNGASNILSGASSIVFANVAYIICIGLSILVPSTSGLAGLSMPIFGPLTQNLGFSPEIMIAILSAASGIVNLVTPTSGVVMGGLAIAKVEYSTWLKFVSKVLISIFVASIIILTVGIMIV